MNNNELRRVAAGTMVFTALSLSLMTGRIATKNILLTDVVAATGKPWVRADAAAALLEDNIQEGENGRIVALDMSSVSGSLTDTEAGFGAEDVTLKTALLLKDISEQDKENDISFVFTGLDANNSDNEKSRWFAGRDGADILVMLDIDDESGEEEGMRTYYNDRFFLNRLSNAEFADIMERNCLALTQDDCRGIAACGDDEEVLYRSQIPSACISIKKLPDKENQAQTQAFDYSRDLAQGIYNGILEAFEVMK